MDGILRKCVHCGFCNATCPTFLLTGDELDGPRGRIYLVKDLLEEDAAPSSAIVEHLDRCLSCLSCMTTCPSGVDYMHLIDHGRAHIEKHYRRPAAARWQRVLLAALLPVPGRFRCTLLLLKLAKPLKSFLPSSVSAALHLSQAAGTAGAAQPLNRFYPAAEDRRGSVALLPGCVQQVMGNHINHASIRVLNRCGFDVHVLTGAPCCGAIEHHLGKQAAAVKRIRTNLACWSPVLGKVDAVISNASGCGTMLKDYHHFVRHGERIRETARDVSERTCDIAEFLHQKGLDFPVTRDTGSLRVVCQHPCSLQHGQAIVEEAPALLERHGFSLVDAADAHLCCGSAGTYNLLQPGFAGELGRRKAASLQACGAQVVASGNLGCLLQIGQYTDIPLVHTVELLDWAGGGPPPLSVREHHNAPFTQ